MSIQVLERIARRAERDLGRSPTLYRLRLAVLGRVGHLLVAFVLLLVVLTLSLIALLLWTIGLFFWGGGIAVALFAVAVIKGLKVQVRVPEGLRLSPRDAPTLFAYLDELRELTGGPRPAAVIVDGSLNAGVVRIPAPAAAGADRQYLLIGLPLFMALSARELRSVLAHEYAHMSRREERFASWVYVTRARWLALLQAFQTDRGLGATAINLLFDRYATYFASYSFPLARAHEYHADALAVRITDAETVATALLRLEVLASYLTTRFWPSIAEQADAKAIEQVEPYEDLARRLDRGDPYADVAAVVEEVMRAQAGFADTHPSLSDRLAAIGMDPPDLSPAANTALEEFLAGNAADVLRSVQEAWRDNERLGWETRYDLVRQSRERISEIDEADGPPPVELLVEKARLWEIIGDIPEATAVYREILETEPRNSRAMLTLGAHLLTQDDDEGIAHMQEAVDLDESFRYEASLHLRNYHLRNGQSRLASLYHEDMLEELRKARAIDDEIVRLPSPDTLEPHDLTPAQVERLVEEIREEPFIEEIYVALRRIAGITEPLYLVGIVGGFGAHTETMEARAGRIHGRIRVLPSTTQVAILKGPLRRLRKVLRKVPGARIF